jgi:flagellar basal-body rod modification protein FlgD
MSVTNSVRDLVNQTARQQATDRQQMIRDSIENPQRNPNATMGKNDFLMLLSVQLRYQNPLEPKNDSEFAAQLAQFSSLEQMMNVSDAMNNLASQHSFNLVGKGVMGIAEIDGIEQAFAGIVDNIFTMNGEQWAAVIEDGGTTIRVPVSSITGVYDSASLLTPNQFITTSNNLIGREVKADWDDETIEGVVTRITVNDGFMYARIEKDNGEAVFVPVGAIFDIREPGTSNEAMPTPPENGENE